MPLLTSTNQSLVSTKVEVSLLQVAAQALSTAVSLPWAALTVITESADGAASPGIGISDVWDTGQCPPAAPLVTLGRQLVSVVSVLSSTSCCLLRAGMPHISYPFLFFFSFFIFFLRISDQPVDSAAKQQLLPGLPGL